MLKIEKTEIYGWAAAVRGMRNPLNSWERSDSFGYWNTGTRRHEFEVGENDLALMKKLVKAGKDHRKFMRMIVVSMDVIAPLYWWKQYDTYKVGTVGDSCSTMHKIAEKEFTIDDFSHEHLTDDYGEEDELVYYNGEYANTAKEVLEFTIGALNHYRELYLLAKTKPMKEEAKRAGLVKRYWWQMIQLLPSNYNQRRTEQLNYEVLRNMYHARKNHKLDCWHTFCDWVENLPYSELITEE